MRPAEDGCRGGDVIGAGGCVQFAAGAPRTGRGLADGDCCVPPNSHIRSPLPLSVLVLTKDEEVNIGSCLGGLAFSDDVLVLDSYSTDRTIDIARTFPNVRVVQRTFDTEYMQRNFGLHEVRYKHPWLYVCDADETVPDDLIEEIREKITDPAATHAAYRLRYKNMFMGKWLRHATSQTVWITRLMRPELVNYEVRATNVHPIVKGTTGDLKARFIHESFRSGLRRWLNKHNFYSSREADEGVRVRAGGWPKWETLVKGDSMSRRRTMKNLSFFLWGRALWRFLHSYLISGGWLDGTPGFHYCSMIAMYEYWIELKMREQRHGWQKRTAAMAERLLREEPGA
jgi:glycosyltransferase involved in cell wall biosynthesis